MSPPSALDATPRSAAGASAWSVACAPKARSSSGTGGPSAATTLSDDAMTTKRSAPPPTNFSRRWAPPPPLTRPPPGPRHADLLARVGAAAALHQPAVGSDLVGAVDRDVEPVELLEGLDAEPELARHPLRGGRRGDAAQPQPPRGERRQEVRDRRA